MNTTRVLVMAVFLLAACAMLVMRSYRPRQALRERARLVTGVGWFVFAIALVERDGGLLALGGLSIAGSWSLGRSA